MKSRELEAEPCCPTLTFLLPVWSPAKSVKRLCGGEQVPGGIRRKSFHICVSTGCVLLPQPKARLPRMGYSANKNRGCLVSLELRYRTSFLA